LKILIKTHNNIETRQFAQLIQGIRDDPEINKRVIQLLKLDSYQRRNVLNRWLEQLRRKSASENLRQALSGLFDDNIAKKVLTLINNRQN
jgi:hypothetical protein